MHNKLKRKAHRFNRTAVNSIIIIILYDKIIQYIDNIIIYDKMGQKPAEQMTEIVQQVQDSKHLFQAQQRQLRTR